MDADVAVVGAGILGLATARELLARHPDSKVLVLERENQVGFHQTGHNSGVIHSGIYYAPGSHKARMCRSGSASMFAFASEHGVDVRRTGKLIVATADEELPRLAALCERGRANGLDVRRITPDEARE